MKDLLRRHWPLLAGIGLYWYSVLFLVILCTKMTQGWFVYPLDDTYIHLSIARNSVLYKVWGVLPSGFTSSTSSPLWTFLLACAIRVFGPMTEVPLVLALLSGTAAILLMYRIFRECTSDTGLVFLLLFLGITAAPLPCLTVAGMEHVLHILLSLAFLRAALGALAGADDLHAGDPAGAGPGSGNHAGIGGLALLAPLLVMCRYEGMFMVLLAAFLLFWRGRWAAAGTVLAMGMLPVVLYGLWSVSQGWHLLPNSVLLKGKVPDHSLVGLLSLLGFTALNQVTSHGLLLILLVGALAAGSVASGRPEGTAGNGLPGLLLFGGTLLLHLQFAATGWLFRYEAYLVVLGLVGLTRSVFSLWPWAGDLSALRRAVAGAPLLLLLTVVLVFPFAHRAVISFLTTPLASKNIYEQQIQMAGFCRQFYQGRGVALNDIGAVAWFSEAAILDLWGLADLESAHLRLKKAFDRESIGELARRRKVSVAIVYDPWYEKYGGLPPAWELVGRWKIANNVACGGDTVSLYAVDPAAREELLENLRKFAPQLPPTVIQFGRYTGN